MEDNDRGYQLALQQFFNDPYFEEMVHRMKWELFEEWSRSTKLEERDRIYAKLEVLEQALTHLRSAADSIAFEKQKDGIING